MIASGRFTVSVEAGYVVVGCGDDDTLAFVVSELPALMYVLARALATECEVSELPPDDEAVPA